MPTDERSPCPVCATPGCIAPSEDEITWHPTPDTLFDICTTPQAWGLLLPELQRLQREYEAGPGFTEREARRQRRQRVHEMKGRR